MVAATTRPAPTQFTARLIRELESRLETNDLRGYTREQIEAAIRFYRGAR